MTWLTTIWQAHKVVILVVAGAALIILTLAVVRGIYTKGETAGAGKITTAVQGEAIKQTEKARQEKERANAENRDKPIDAVIDGLR